MRTLEIFFVGYNYICLHFCSSSNGGDSGFCSGSGSGNSSSNNNNNNNNNNDNDNDNDDHTVSGSPKLASAITLLSRLFVTWIPLERVAVVAPAKRHNQSISLAPDGGSGCQAARATCSLVGWPVAGSPVRRAPPPGRGLRPTVCAPPAARAAGGRVAWSLAVGLVVPASGRDELLDGLLVGGGGRALVVGRAC